MSKTRQPLDESGFVIRALSVNYRPGARLDSHHHDWPQLVYAASGVLSVEVANGCWVVPPHRAVWVPAGMSHTIDMTGTVAMRTLYLAPELIASMPQQCVTIEVSALLRELILETARLGMLHREIPVQERLIGVILDQLAHIEQLKLRLPMPVHPRLRAAAERLRKHPSGQSDLETFAKDSHFSTRTVERLFMSETQLTFVQWRQRSRMLHALQLLASGESVTNVALAVGYQSSSAFIAAFKRELGVTPTHYYQNRKAQ